jgi:hypothetical protein
MAVCFDIKIIARLVVVVVVVVQAYFGVGCRLELEVTFNLIGDLILLRRVDEASRVFASALDGLSAVVCFLILCWFFNL